MARKKSLLEASKEMLDANVKAKQAQQEKTKDISGGVGMGQETEPAETKVKKPNTLPGKGATPPGKTPPMGQEPMRSVDGSGVKDDDLDTGASGTVPGESMKSIGSAVKAVREGKEIVIEDAEDLAVGDTIFNEETDEEGVVVGINEDTGEIVIDWLTESEEDDEDEDTEQLDEISKKLLGRYITKASKSTSSFGSESNPGLAKKDAELERTSDALHAARYRGRPSDAAQDHMRVAKDEIEKERSKVRRKTWNRDEGIRRAVKRLTKEDFNIDDINLEEEDDTEQLDEISKKVLGNYIKKAKVSHDESWNTFGTESNKASDLLNKSGLRHIKKVDKHITNAGAAHNTWKKRRAGIERATDRLTKEDFNIDDIHLEEDVAAILSGEDLSEEFQTKVAVLFETAVKAKVQEYIDIVEELNEERLQEQYNETLETLEGDVSKFMAYVAEQWREDNRVEIEKQLRTELAERVIEDIRNVFLENNINIPEEKLEVVDELLDANKSLEESISEEIEKTIDLKEQLEEMTRINLIYEALDELEEDDRARMRPLYEALDFDGDIDSFRERAELVRNSYLTEQKTPRSKRGGKMEDDSYINEENMDILTEEKVPVLKDRGLAEAVKLLKKNRKPSEDK